MKFTITKTEMPVSITILRLEGILDGANYKSLIKESQNVFEGGARDLILDLSQLDFISSAGLAALHMVALLFRGETDTGKSDGWDAFHSIDRDRDNGIQEHVKLLSPSEQVRRVLEMTGFDRLFEISTDLQQATASFPQVDPVMEPGLA